MVTLFHPGVGLPDFRKSKITPEPDIAKKGTIHLKSRKNALQDYQKILKNVFKVESIRKT